MEKLTRNSVVVVGIKVVLGRVAWETVPDTIRSLGWVVQFRLKCVSTLELTGAIPPTGPISLLPIVWFVVFTE